jgi:hypothetical protein
MSFVVQKLLPEAKEPHPGISASPAGFIPKSPTAWLLLGTAFHLDD